MNLALLYPQLHAQGGTERFTLDLARTLLELGDDVHVFANRADSLPSGVHFHYVRQCRLGRVLKMVSFDRSCRRMVFPARPTISSSAPFDCVMSLGRTSDQDVLRLGGGCHRAYQDALFGRWSLRRLAPAHQYLLQWERQQFCSFRRQLWIAPSQRVKQEILSYYPVSPDRLYVIPNGVDLERFTAQPDSRLSRELRLSLDIPTEAVVFLFVGNGLLRKGYSDTLRAYHTLVRSERARGSKQPLRLLVVSRDALKRKWRHWQLEAECRQLDAPIMLIGSAADVVPVYAISDVLLLPTRYEPFGNVCLEALAMGLVVLTTGVNGFSELLPPELAGYCAEPTFHLETWVRHMRTFLNPNVRQLLASHGKSIATSHSIHQNGRLIRDVLLEARYAPRQSLQLY